MTDNLDTLETIADQRDIHANTGNLKRNTARKRGTGLTTFSNNWRQWLASAIHNSPKSYPYLSKREE